MRLPFQRGVGAPSREDADAGEVRAAAVGDEAAFETLVVRHQRALYHFALRLLGDRADAEDAVQEAFLRAWRSLPRFRGQATFRTWLVGIAINVCRSHMASAESRRWRRTESLVRHDPVSGDETALPLPDPAPGPDARAHGTEIRAALEHALAAISREHREILLLREMNGLEYDELAAALGCAVGTVKSRLARARAALRRSLEGVWP